MWSIRVYGDAEEHEYQYEKYMRILATITMFKHVLYLL